MLLNRGTSFRTKPHPAQVNADGVHLEFLSHARPSTPAPWLEVPIDRGTAGITPSPFQRTLKLEMHTLIRKESYRIITQSQN